VLVASGSPGAGFKCKCKLSVNNVCCVTQINTKYKKIIHYSLDIRY
jgi:hypothetical protein